MSVVREFLPAELLAHFMGISFTPATAMLLNHHNRALAGNQFEIAVEDAIEQLNLDLYLDTDCDAQGRVRAYLAIGATERDIMLLKMALGF